MTFDEALTRIAQLRSDLEGLDDLIDQAYEKSEVPASEIDALEDRRMELEGSLMAMERMWEV